MKLLLFLTATCFLPGTGNAQQETFELQNSKQYQALAEQLKNKRWAPVNDTARTLQNSSVFLSNSTPGVHRLPLDGMPCIVPDTKEIAAIRNAFKGKVTVPFTGNPPHIPNPYQTTPFQFRSKIYVPVSPGKK
jgi:hypothetical protein